jgi:hypothetical protein
MNRGYWLEIKKEKIMMKMKTHRVGNVKSGWGGMAWIDLAQDKDQWRALVNTVMNLLIS